MTYPTRTDITWAIQCRVPIPRADASTRIAIRHLAEAASKLFYWASQRVRSCGLPAAGAAARLRRRLGGDYLAIAKGEKGTGERWAASGPQRALPAELLAEALDQGAAVSFAATGTWRRSRLNRPLASCSRPFAPGPARPSAAARFETLTHWLHLGLTEVRSRQQRPAADRPAAGDSRNRRPVAADATRWSRCWRRWPRRRRSCSRPTGPASSCGTRPTTRSSAGRRSASKGASCGFPTTPASSARWSKPASRGASMPTSRPSSARSTAASISELKFQTRSLLCVPLRGRKGELFGAFEVLNKLGGNFTADDEQALTELAAHAAVALENTQQCRAASRPRASRSPTRPPKACSSSARARRSRPSARRSAASPTPTWPS